MPVSWFRIVVSQLSLSFDSGEDSLDPRRFDVRETISRCFNVKLVAMSPNDDLDLDALVGRPARFTMRSRNGGVSRVFRCVCLGAGLVQAEEKGLSTYEIELGPKLALLAYRSRYRATSFDHDRRQNKPKRCDTHRDDAF